MPETKKGEISSIGVGGLDPETVLQLIGKKIEKYDTSGIVCLIVHEDNVFSCVHGYDRGKDEPRLLLAVELLKKSLLEGFKGTEDK